MKIAISGATGFIGFHLSAALTAKGHEVVPLGRDVLAEVPAVPLSRVLSGCDVVINLAGAPIDRRWTRAYKKELYDSRILTTRRIVGALREALPRPGLLISASAVGWYPADGRSYDESAGEPGEGFLSRLCRDWEAEALCCSGPLLRVAVTRFGVVLDSRGGAFVRMAGPARKGVSVAVGPGTQPFSWIALEDLIRGMQFLIDTPVLHGVFNFTASDVSQVFFARMLAQHYHSRFTVTVPAFVFRLLFGEMSSVLTTGRCLHADRLRAAGFSFKYPRIGAFLRGLDHPLPDTVFRPAAR